MGKKKAADAAGAFLVIYLLNFSIPRLMPGDPLTTPPGPPGDDVDAAYSEEQKELLRAYYGLTSPFSTAEGHHCGQPPRGLLARVSTKRPVADILLERLPWSLWIMGEHPGPQPAPGGGPGPAVRPPALGRPGALPPSPPWRRCFFLTGVLLLFLVAARAAWIPLSGAYTPSPSTTACGSGWGTSWCTA